MRLSKVPQATIAKLEGFARGGGHELALALDMRFAARGKFKFMQMEVSIGILPCGRGASRMARQTGLGRAMEIILSAQDYDADDAGRMGTINKALDPDDIGAYVNALAHRSAQFPAEAINARKQMVYQSFHKPIVDALKAGAYWLYQATSKTPAVKRFAIADEQGLEHDIENPRNWGGLVMQVQGGRSSALWFQSGGPKRDLKCRRFHHAPAASCDTRRRRTHSGRPTFDLSARCGGPALMGA